MEKIVTQLGPNLDLLHPLLSAACYLGYFTVLCFRHWRAQFAKRKFGETICSVLQFQKKVR